MKTVLMFYKISFALGKTGQRILILKAFVCLTQHGGASDKFTSKYGDDVGSSVGLFQVNHSLVCLR